MAFSDGVGSCTVDIDALLGKEARARVASYSSLSMKSSLLRQVSGEVVSIAMVSMRRISTLKAVVGLDGLVSS